MEDASKLDELSKAINSFIDEYDYYLFGDRNQRLKPEIDRFIRELDNLTEAISIPIPLKQTSQRSNNVPKYSY
jgi:hypothetical protein